MLINYNCKVARYKDTGEGMMEGWREGGMGEGKGEWREGERERGQEGEIPNLH